VLHFDDGRPPYSSAGGVNARNSYSIEGIMKLRGVLLVVAAGLLIGADAKEDLKKEQDKLKGTWSVIAIEVPKGEKGPSDKEIKEMKIIFAEDKVTMNFGEDEGQPASYRLGPVQEAEGNRHHARPQNLEGDLHAGRRHTEDLPDRKRRSSQRVQAGRRQQSRPHDTQARQEVTALASAEG